MDSAYISALSALAGSSIGAFATFATTWLNQSYQNRIQRRANEMSRRERLFGDFVDEAAKVFGDALVNRLDDPAKLVRLYALKSRLSLFASVEVIEKAEDVLRAVAVKYYSDKTDYSNLVPGDIDLSTRKNFDILHDFTKACREELVRS